MSYRQFVKPMCSTLFPSNTVENKNEALLKNRSGDIMWEKLMELHLLIPTEIEIKKMPPLPKNFYKDLWRIVGLWLDGQKDMIVCITNLVTNSIVIKNR